MNLTIAGFFKRGVKPEQPSWATRPLTDEFGDWTWSYRLRSWLGTYVLKSSDGGRTWTRPIPVNVRPLKHAGCRLGALQMPDGPILLGVYGRIHQYGEEDPMETSRSALVRSDDGGDNWEYYSTIAFDPASIIDYDEPATIRLQDGRLVCMLRTHSHPSGDQKNTAFVVSEDEGFTWSSPKWTNIWGYPSELINLQDGRVLMVYGYRRPPYGTRGCISEDGLTWDRKNEFVIRDGGVPKNHPSINWEHPGSYLHIGYPSVCQLEDGTIVCAYHEWTDEADPIQIAMCTRFRLAD
ncbi:MAG: exo-alpha-sialidase [Chloroflexi bacterium]|nr:exo-alpha-sialidase [Chloroflexota bacterium]